jgi:hypothetical protein
MCKAQNNGKSGPLLLRPQVPADTPIVCRRQNVLQEACLEVPRHRCEQLQAYIREILAATHQKAERERKSTENRAQQDKIVPKVRHDLCDHANQAAHALHERCKQSQTLQSGMEVLLKLN